MVTLMNSVSYTSGNVRVTVNKQGASQYTKMSFPLHAGVFHEVQTRECCLHFNLNNEIVRAWGRGTQWPHPHEWLKRNMGNDWIYYSTGGYTGVFEATGEYYLPNLPYTTNGLLGGKPFQRPEVASLIDNWPEILQKILRQHHNIQPDIHVFLEKAAGCDNELLARKADKLFAACGGRSTVLPPDARHVDYNVIPLTVATGCLYKCRFCEVKNKQPFQPLTAAGIVAQIRSLMALYGDNLGNYNSVFLGEHDALQAGPELLRTALEEAYSGFRFSQSYLQGCCAFMFGSVTSLENSPDSFFQWLQDSPYTIYINIGLESADQQTLDTIGKPITASDVGETFQRIQDINDRYSSLEISANFLLDDDLPPSHLPAFLELVRDKQQRVKDKGCIYLSPLKFGQPSRSQTFGFNRLKVLSRLPTFLYIIQRL